MKKKALSTLLIVVLTLAVLMSVCAFVVLMYFNMPVAFAEEPEAEDDAEYPFFVKAAVSNLEGNEYAVAGTVAVRGANNDRREFFIPESYFVKVVQNILDTFYEIEYAGQQFYVNIRTSLAPTAVTFEQDEKFYPDLTLTLAEGIDLSATDGVDDSLKKLDDTYTVKFLGYAADPETPDLIYVMATPAEGKTLFGFIPRSAFEAFDVPYQARTQTEREELLAAKEQATPPPDAGSLPAPEGSLTLKIILILGISLPAVIIVILLFVPSRHDEPVRKGRGASSDGRDYDDPSARYPSDRQRYDQSRSYGAPRNGYDRPPYQEPPYSSDPYNSGGQPYGPDDYDRR